MIAVILNDTSHYHYGCKKVIEYLISDLQSCGYTDIKLVGQDIKKIQEANYRVGSAACAERLNNVWYIMLNI